MTCIAYRDGIMAGDGRETNQNTEDESWFKVRDNCIKVFKLDDGSLFGAAHSSEDIEILTRWLKQDPLCSTLPPDLEDVTALLVKPTGEFYMTEGKIWVPAGLDYYAIGSGGLVANAAMDAGATAKKAVEIACNRDLWCGGLITTVQK